MLQVQRLMALTVYSPSLVLMRQAPYLSENHFMEPMSSHLVHPGPTADRPLLGVTVLVVEDSRFASEAIRLMCLRSGARLRRANTLANAKRHLRVYRPDVLIVDAGLPDGSGVSLVRAAHHASPRIDVILGTSGDDMTATALRGAGADGFIPKPIESLAAFQAALLRHLPAERQPPSPRAIPNDLLLPDEMALHDDLHHAADILSHDPQEAQILYISQFLDGIANTVNDPELRGAAQQLAKMAPPTERQRHMQNLSAMLDLRIARTAQM